MIAAKNTTRKKPDYSNYKFDTSTYVIIDTDVKRDKDTGRLISVVSKKKAKKAD